MNKYFYPRNIICSLLTLSCTVCSPDKINSVVCYQRVLEELGDISLRVDNVKDQAIILMTSRGAACRDVVEPKLSELNFNFDRVSQHIRTAQVQKCRHFVTLKLFQSIFKMHFCIPKTSTLSVKDVCSYCFLSFDPQMMTSLESGGLKLNQQVL